MADISPHLPPHPASPLGNDPDDHLSRLFAADKAEIPWFVSLYRTVHDLIKPEKLPPLELTSRPIAVKDIWGKDDKDAQSKFISVGIHIAVFALLMLVGTNKAVQNALKQVTPLYIDVTPFKPAPKPAGGGGGGGDRSITPVTKGQLPKPSLKQFVPPMIVQQPPKLAMTPTIVAPPDTILPQNDLPQWGDPLAKLGIASNGSGSGAGMGSGSGGGVGSGNGGGFGSGSGGGIGGGIFKVGGGVTQPLIITKVDPEYSEEARKAKYSGTVTLAVIVDAEGHVREPRVIKSLGMGLDEKAMEAVMKWKFKPGMKGNQAVNVRATIEVNFRLL